MKTMTHAAKSVLVFGVYMFIMGATLIVTPHTMLSLLGIDMSAPDWLRVLGWALAVLGYYYIRAAQINFTQFFRWTVCVRVLQFFFFLALVYVLDMPMALLLLAVVECASGLWTYLALKKAP